MFVRRYILVCPQTNSAIHFPHFLLVLITTNINVATFLSQVENIYVAAYEFRPEEEGELYFKRGDKIEVLDKEDSNWWKGKNLTSGEEGLFPSTYVQKKD